MTLTGNFKFFLMLSVYLWSTLCRSLYIFQYDSMSRRVRSWRRSRRGTSRTRCRWVRRMRRSTWPTVRRPSSGSTSWTCDSHGQWFSISADSQARLRKPVMNQLKSHKQCMLKNVNIMVPLCRELEALPMLYIYYI